MPQKDQFTATFIYAPYFTTPASKTARSFNLNKSHTRKILFILNHTQKRIPKQEFVETENTAAFALFLKAHPQKPTRLSLFQKAPTAPPFTATCGNTSSPPT